MDQSQDDDELDDEQSLASFVGYLFDYYFEQGGGYFGAKKALQPVSVVWDYYATGDRTAGHVYVVNHQLEPVSNVSVAVRFYNLDGTQNKSPKPRTSACRPALQWMF